MCRTALVPTAPPFLSEVDAEKRSNLGGYRAPGRDSRDGGAYGILAVDPLVRWQDLTHCTGVADTLSWHLLNEVGNDRASGTASCFNVLQHDKGVIVLNVWASSLHGWWSWWIMIDLNSSPIIPRKLIVSMICFPDSETHGSQCVPSPQDQRRRFEAGIFLTTPAFLVCKFNSTYCTQMMSVWNRLASFLVGQWAATTSTLWAKICRQRTDENQADSNCIQTYSDDDRRIGPQPSPQFMQPASTRKFRIRET